MKTIAKISIILIVVLIISSNIAVAFSLTKDIESGKVSEPYDIEGNIIYGKDPNSSDVKAVYMNNNTVKWTITKGCMSSCKDIKVSENHNVLYIVNESSDPFGYVHAHKKSDGSHIRTTSGGGTIGRDSIEILPSNGTAYIAHGNGELRGLDKNGNVIPNIITNAFNSPETIELVNHTLYIWSADAMIELDINGTKLRETDVSDAWGHEGGMTYVNDSGTELLFVTVDTNTAEQNTGDGMLEKFDIESFSFVGDVTISKKHEIQYLSTHEDSNTIFVENSTGNEIVRVNTSPAIINTTTAEAVGEIYSVTNLTTNNIDLWTGDNSKVIKYTTDIAANSSFTPNFTINLQVNDYMAYDSNQKYIVIKDNGTTTDITDKASVSSSNSNIIQVIESNSTLLSTDNRSLSGKIKITATYQAASDTKNITVANQTLDNIKIMPSERWFHSFIGFDEEQAKYGIGSELQWIVLAIIFGAGSGYVFSNEWVGNATLLFALILFWVMDNVSLGIVLSAMAYAILVSLLAMEIPQRTNIKIQDTRQK